MVLRRVAITGIVPVSPVHSGEWGLAMSSTLSEVFTEPGLGPESLAMVEAVHRFARDEMRPVGQQLD